MHRIDGPGATAGNQFTAGDPGTGAAATTVTADWLNSVQEELAKVITSAGVGLDKTKLDQLWTALTAYFAAKAAADAHYAAGAPHAGHETPAGAQGKVDTHAALTSPHSATSVATASRLVVRDGASRAKFAEGVATGDAVVFSQFANSLGSAGYQKLPGGLILQWGELVSAGTSGNIILPIAFPNEFFAVFTSDNKGGPDVITVGANRTSLSQFAWYGTNTSTGASAVPQTWSWFALGR